MESNTLTGELYSSAKQKLAIFILRFITFFLTLILLVEVIVVSFQVTGNESSLYNIIYSYQDQKEIWVSDVSNKVKIGNLAGNRNLEFGVKNLLEENLQEMGYELNPKSENTLKIEIIYLDVLKTNQNVSVFHKNEEQVVIRMKGILYKNDTKIREVIADESSSEISMSTLMIDNGGKFNQTSLSNAIKKCSEKIINKIIKN